LYGGSAIIASLIFGVLCDLFSVKRVGFAVIILTVFTLSFLYMGIFSKTFPATMILFVFIGLTTFGLGGWLLCVSSKVFGGKF
jgi:predicted MFS family arabinose efflux permease